MFQNSRFRANKTIWGGGLLILSRQNKNYDNIQKRGKRRDGSLENRARYKNLKKCLIK